ncbi:RelA/SpoT family protein [Dictyobacter arantiisoli]|uniref:(P)ppGpp synthetase n=1 Tax=Dictyobacter arantiisoli TaxID=2014874 RepID=A0A5A5T7N7_9CHLR|nr:bifunctional (p)ppGpp synthetase/guanosine-3',5'-bis(diphosphate) 3'-pyrophosphohydrolase [Dictyobacter arantiisoli]GCF07480.1 (p)ppGpp synthetase [Dictyobacter arantiisoli]
MATNFDKIADESDKSSDTQAIVPMVRTTMTMGAKVTQSRMTIQDLLTETRQYLTPEDMEKIQRAYDLAHRAHKGALRRSGEPYIQHPLEVALLLAGMRIDADGIVSALLHDVVEDTEYSLEDLREQFGSSVAHIVDGVTKFDTLAGTKPAKSGQEGASTAVEDQATLTAGVPPSLVDKRRIRTETVRKMLLAMAEDPRVVVVKLADRLHNMRTLGAMSTAQQQNTSRETSEIYAPLARRLGMSLVQADLEDLSFGYLEPEKYVKLAKQVAEEVKRRMPFITEVCRVLRDEMRRAGIHADVLAWQKHLASINRKLEDVPAQLNGNELSQIHDLISFRILVDSDYECYLALGHIHALWRPKDGRIKDFIATPKLNGYQSLHTTVFCLENRLAEIQIRTYDMQRTADYGIASYWFLKERMGHADKEQNEHDEAKPGSWRLSYREMMTWIEQLREWQRALPQGADEFVEAVKGDIFQEQIFVFTPQGEVKDLPRGSTPLDMAYRIHTDLGDHCAGARIITNTDDSGHLVTRLVPLDYELKGGEIVEIMVNRTVHPTRDWLSFARTAAARNKIRRYLKTYEREINLQLGRERLDFALKTAGMAGLNELVESLLYQLYIEEPRSLLLSKKYSMLEDIYVALGREDVQVEQVLTPLQEQLPPCEESDENENSFYPHKDGEKASPLQLGRCCCPVPGDAIVGQMTRDQGVVIHRCDCEQLHRNPDTANHLIEFSWQQIHPENYLVAITLVAHDRSGLLRDVAAVVTDAGINMVSVTSTTNPASQKAVITATLEIAANAGAFVDQMERILRRLRQVKTVVSVERAPGK